MLISSVSPNPNLYAVKFLKFDVRASSSNRKSLKKLKRESSQQSKDITRRNVTEEEEEVAQVDDFLTSNDSVNDVAVVAAPRDKVLQACTITSGLMAVLGLIIRKVSHEGLYLSLTALQNYHILTSLEPLDYLVVAVLPGISEELLFRGALMPLFGTNWKGIVAVGLIFCFLHLGSGRKYSFAVWASIVGIVYGYAAVLSSSLVVPMVSHALNNLVGGLVWRYTSKLKSLE